MIDSKKLLVNKLARDEMYNYEFILDFGWASHLNARKEGIVVNFKDGELALIYEINNKLILQDEENFNTDQLADLHDLINWIES